MSLKINITEDMKHAMRAQNKPKLQTIRLILSAIKQKEVDERIELSDQDILIILDKMIKQRRESLKHYEAASRQDLANQEIFEMSIIQDYLPLPLDKSEINTLIRQAIEEVGATHLKDMGKVMNLLKPKLQGRCDMSTISKKISVELTQSSE